jgi:PAS domain S-box-containing protein
MSLAFSGDVPGLDFKLLINALQTAISEVTITDNKQAGNPILYCNKAFINMTGYGKHEIIGRNFRFLHSDNRS